MLSSIFGENGFASQVLQALEGQDCLIAVLLLALIFAFLCRGGFREIRKTQARNNQTIEKIIDRGEQ